MKTYYLKPAVYILGDPVWVLSDHNYQTVWGGTFEFNEGKIIINDCAMIVHRTGFGDGVYRGTDGNRYFCESGTLAMIPFGLVDTNRFSENINLFRTFDFTGKRSDIILTYEDAIFTLYAGGFLLQIDTNIP